MTGPSSSHTAGPGRIGLFIGKLMDKFDKILIEFPKSGSYLGTYRGQRSVVAFVAGILGYDIIDPHFKNSLSIAKNRGISVEITINDREIIHPNTSFITLASDHKRICVESWSTGGGMFEIKSINEASVICKGDCHEIVLFDDSDENRLLNAFLTIAERDSLVLMDEIFLTVNGVINVKLKEAPSQEMLNAFKEKASALGGDIRYIAPLLPVAWCSDAHVPFLTSKELEMFIRDNEMPLWKAAVCYETKRSGWNEDQVLKFAQNLVEVMRDSVVTGLKSDFETSGFLSPTACQIHHAKSAGRLIDTGVIGNAAIYSVAVMEYNSAMGIVVASPTAGSCGVIPGVLFGIAGIDSIGIEENAKALLCAGLIGIFIANQATFSAEVCGCQAENGAASCLASAIASYFLGSDLQTTLNAASAALQNMLGLICDPVAGYTDIPCITRNTMAVSNAIVSANLAAGGFDSVIPLDETIQIMLEVGRMLPSELRCTGLGGLCVTFTGQEILRKVCKDC